MGWNRTILSLRSWKKDFSLLFFFGGGEVWVFSSNFSWPPSILSLPYDNTLVASVQGDIQSW